MLGVLALRRLLGALLGVVEVGEARVVELQVATAEVVHRTHLARVGGGEVRPELVDIRVDAAVDRGGPAAVVDHARRRDGELRHSGSAPRLRGSGRRRRRSARSSRTFSRTARPAEVNSVSPCSLCMRTLDLLVGLGDPAELVDEVHVPRGAAELAVRGGLQPDLLLHRDHVPDGGVLRGPQVLGVEGAGRELLPRPRGARVGAAGCRRGRHGTAVRCVAACPEPNAMRRWPCGARRPHLPDRLRHRRAHAGVRHRGARVRRAVPHRAHPHPREPGVAVVRRAPSCPGATGTPTTRSSRWPRWRW